MMMMIRMAMSFKKKIDPHLDQSIVENSVPIGITKIIIILVPLEIKESRTRSTSHRQAKAWFDI
jgi:hypothetical protein